MLIKVFDINDSKNFSKIVLLLEKANEFRLLHDFITELWIDIFFCQKSLTNPLSFSLSWLQQ